MTEDKCKLYMSVRISLYLQDIKGVSLKTLPLSKTKIPSGGGRNTFKKHYIESLHQQTLKYFSIKILM